MELAYRIRKIRESLCFTQAEIANKIDISPQAYGKMERKANKTKFETLQKLSKAFDIPISFIVDIENKEFIFKKNNL